MHTYYMIGVGVLVIAFILGTIVKNWPVYQRDINEALKREEDDY